MNNERKHAPSRGLTRSIFLRMLVAIVIYSIGLVLAVIAAIYFFTRFTWLPGDPIYRILKPIRDNLPIFMFITWVLGLMVIVFYFLRRSLKNIDTLSEASKLLVDGKEEWITLPSELIQVEERLNRIKQESIQNMRLAKEAEQRKNDLIVYLAHDLKTPLTSVIGYLTLLRDEAQISEELRQKYLAISLEKAERLEELINEFFEITRFNLSQLHLELEEVNLTRMLEQISYEFHPLLIDKNLSVNLVVKPNLLITCDRNKMERVFDNLIRNAIYYSYENSTIDIRAYHTGDTVNIHFINRGKTIPKEKLHRIFEQFYRLDHSRGTRTGGAGLGLAIVKEIVERHGGTIVAMSEHETIEFKIELPLAS